MSNIASIALADRTITLRALHCTATYSGNLEGPHTAPRNAARIAALCRRAGEVFSGAPVLLIEPVRTSGPVIDGYVADGKPVLREMLPRLCFMGAFASTEVAGADGCESALTIVWFDDATLGDPVEAPLANLLLGIDWDRHAHSYWY